MQCKADDLEGGHGSQRGMHWYVLEYLAPTSDMISFLESELNAGTILSPRELGKLLRRTEYFEAFKDTIEELCKDHFKTKDWQWQRLDFIRHDPDLDQFDRSHRLYLLLQSFLDREGMEPLDVEWGDDFLIYISDLVNDPFIRLGKLMGSNPIFLTFLRALGRHNLNSDLADELMGKIINNEELKLCWPGFFNNTFLPASTKEYEKHNARAPMLREKSKKIRKERKQLKASLHTLVPIVKRGET